MKQQTQTPEATPLHTWKIFPQQLTDKRILDNDGRKNHFQIGYDNYDEIDIWYTIGEDKEEAKANAELIVKAVNERQALLDSNKELIAALKQLHGYTSSKVKSYNIKDTTYFETINIMANGLHNKIK